MAVTFDMLPQGALSLRSGTLLSNNYELLKRIGDGSFGIVELARVKVTKSNLLISGSVVAIKTAKKSFESLTPCMDLREVVFLKNMPPNEHLVPALDIFHDPSTRKLHIVMECMDGSLYQLIKARNQNSLAATSVQSIIFQTMRGLKHIHDYGFFHRDIKPENILYAASEAHDALPRGHSSAEGPPARTEYAIKIADFGLARPMHSRKPYTNYVSTRWYRAPEVLLRANSYSGPVDIWAMGAMIVEIATLRALFPGGNEVEQVWKVCEIMGSPGKWLDRHGHSIGGGEWKEGVKLAATLGFSFPKMAPQPIESVLRDSQWSSDLSDLVSWCLRWDPKMRPTPDQALDHPYFKHALDPLRRGQVVVKPMSRKPSSSMLNKLKITAEPQVLASSTTTWFRNSLIGADSTSSNGKEIVSSPACPDVISPTDLDVSNKQRTSRLLRPSWLLGGSAASPGPAAALGPRSPNVKPVPSKLDSVPLSGAITDQQVGGVAFPKSTPVKKVGRQLSERSSDTHGDAERHRRQSEWALDSRVRRDASIEYREEKVKEKEGFFSHLRKKARRFSGRYQTPMSPDPVDVEASGASTIWRSNRSSVAVEPTQLPTPQRQPSESDATLMGALRAVQYDIDSSISPTHSVPTPSSYRSLAVETPARTSSLTQAYTRSMDNLGTGGRSHAIAARTRRSYRVPAQYEAPAEEDELEIEAQMDGSLQLNRASSRSMDELSKKLGVRPRKPLAQATENSGRALPANPYATPESKSGSGLLYAHRQGQGDSLSLLHGSEDENAWSAALVDSILGVEPQMI